MEGQSEVAEARWSKPLSQDGLWGDCASKGRVPSFHHNQWVGQQGKTMSPLILGCRIHWEQLWVRNPNPSGPFWHPARTAGCATSRYWERSCPD